MRCQIKRNKKQGKTPNRALSHRQRWLTEKESRSESPLRRREAASAKNIISTPSILEILPNISPTVFSVEKVSRFKVSDSRHASLNSVHPSKLAGLGDRVRVSFEDDFASCTPNAPEKRNTENIPSCDRGCRLRMRRAIPGRARLDSKCQFLPGRKLVHTEGFPDTPGPRPSTPGETAEAKTMFIGFEEPAPTSYAITRVAQVNGLTTSIEFA
jgi:hypothetical protein